MLEIDISHKNEKLLKNENISLFIISYLFQILYCKTELSFTKEINNSQVLYFNLCEIIYNEAASFQNTKSIF